MKNNYMILAEIIKNRRIALGYSLRNLANEVGISHTELVRIENGNRQCLNTITLLKICKLYPLIQKFGYYIENTYTGNKILTRYF